MWHHDGRYSNIKELAMRGVTRMKKKKKKGRRKEVPLLDHEILMERQAIFHRSMSLYTSLHFDMQWRQSFARQTQRICQA